jgi:hypothetical protein
LDDVRAYEIHSKACGRETTDQGKLWWCSRSCEFAAAHVAATPRGDIFAITLSRLQGGAGARREGE